MQQKLDHIRTRMCVCDTRMLLRIDGGVHQLTDTVHDETDRMKKKEVGHCLRPHCCRHPTHALMPHITFLIVVYESDNSHFSTMAPTYLHIGTRAKKKQTLAEQTQAATLYIYTRRRSSERRLPSNPNSQFQQYEARRDRNVLGMPVCDTGKPNE